MCIYTLETIVQFKKNILANGDNQMFNHTCFNLDDPKGTCSNFLINISFFNQINENFSGNVYLNYCALINSTYYPLYYRNLDKVKGCIGLVLINIGRSVLSIKNNLIIKD